MSAPEPKEQTARTRPWVRIALFASLALNLLVVGLVAGAVLSEGRRDGGPDRRPALADLGFGPYVEALRPRDRMALARGLRRESGAFRDNRAEVRAQFQEILAALRADPYDPAALEALVTAQQSKLAERQALGRGLLLERLEAMEPAARAAYADRLEALLRRPPPPPPGAER